ncbi:MAG: hypothetical protein L0H83_01555, partial [Salinisphaera sp.]|nr:hypothetical protein [Salinisphaera sp.]
RGEEKPAWPSKFTADFQPQLLARTKEVAQGRELDLQLVDARPTSYFVGQVKSSSARSAGTIPGALSIPDQLFLEKGEGGAWFFEPQRVATVIEQSDLDTNAPVATFCNTGTWAASDWFALSEILGMKNISLYDGSMAAWTADNNLPVQVTKAGRKSISTPAAIGN